MIDDISLVLEDLGHSGLPHESGVDLMLVAQLVAEATQRMSCLSRPDRISTEMSVCAGIQQEIVRSLCQSEGIHEFRRFHGPGMCGGVFMTQSRHAGERVDVFR